MSHCDDYCCNHGCNQGRDCPARVAKVGKRMQAAKPLNGSPWRRQLKDLARGFLLMLAVMLVSAITVGAMRWAA